MLDGSERPRAELADTVDLCKKRYEEVGAASAHADGEGDRSLAYWRHAHRCYFSSKGQLAEDMMLYRERFRVKVISAG